MEKIKSFQITGMTISGFKCYQEPTELAFGNPTIITGGNGRGKTSVADAIVQLGTNEWHDVALYLADQYFDGVTRLLIPDNCKTATTVNTRYETVSNRSYQELAEYYGTTIIPARIRKPQDKSEWE